jgi:hypothetical protein
LAVTVLCLAGLRLLSVELLQFLDDLAFLLSENDAKTIAIILDLLLVMSAALWLLSCCLGALARKWLLHLRGL